MESCFLNNYYLKGKRSVEKPVNAGPAAYVMTRDERFTNRQLQLLRVLALQHVEVQQLKEATKIFRRVVMLFEWISHFPGRRMRCWTGQFWSPEDPQKNAYDDTGWSFGDLFNAKVTRGDGSGDFVGSDVAGV